MELFGTILCVTMLIVTVICMLMAVRAYDKKDYITAFWEMLWAILFTICIQCW